MHSTLSNDVTSPDGDPPQSDQSAGQRRVRVALLITELDVGGAERTLVRLACGLDRQAFEVQVCSIAPLPFPANDLVRQLQQVRVPVHSLNTARGWQFAAARRRLRRWLNDFAPDVLQSFLYHANVLAALARPAELPHVLGVRVADPRRWRQVIERRIARRAARVVTVSHGVEQHLHRHGFPSERLLTIANGIEINEWAEARPADTEPFGIANQRRLLLCAGRLDVQKGYDWLFSQAPELLARLPNHDLVILGEGPQRRALSRWAHELAVPVHVLGWQPDMASWLARSELLLLPSRYEGMPNVVLEAMAAGRAVVATDVEGVSELLGTTAGPQVVPRGDATAFLNQVVELATDEALRTRCARENQQRARAEFSTERMVARYAQLYRELTAARR